MAKPNYAFEKRQRELAKKRKKEEKASRKAQGRPDGPEGDEPAEGAEAAPSESMAAGDSSAPAVDTGGAPH